MSDVSRCTSLTLIRRLRKEFGDRDEHHPNCASRSGKGWCPHPRCNCYNRGSAEAHEILDELLKRLADKK